MNVAYPVVVVVTGAVVFISAAQLLFSLPPTQPIKNKKNKKMIRLIEATVHYSIFKLCDANVYRLLLSIECRRMPWTVDDVMTATS